jgi:YesN/AraC family two-component response regulator
LGEAFPARSHEGFDLESAYQGEEALEKILQAREQDCPFAVAFVDIRMPPGWDGIETIQRVWSVDPELQFVICSAYSDYSAREILHRLGVSDRLLMLRKPCDAAEILLMAVALCEKWNLARGQSASWLNPKTLERGAAWSADSRIRQIRPHVRWRDSDDDLQLT